VAIIEYSSGIGPCDEAVFLVLLRSVHVPSVGLNNCSNSRSAFDVVVFAFGFSKAFATVRHKTPSNKMVTLELSDNIYNWIKDFFSNRQRRTRFAGQRSSVAGIAAGVIQGAGLGLASYIVHRRKLVKISGGARGARIIGGGRGEWLGDTMASAEHEPITGVWGQSRQRGPGAEPQVRGKLKAF